MAGDFRLMATKAKIEVCACGNYPLTDEDIAAGRNCICCRVKHLFYHDDQFCRRCGCPVGQAP